MDGVSLREITITSGAMSSAAACALCLSVGRVMFSADDVSWAYSAVLDLRQPSPCQNAAASAHIICWECRAILRKLQRFRTQAALAQNLLSSGEARSLSRLATARGQTLHVLPDQQNLQFDFKECKTELEDTDETSPQDVWVNSVHVDNADDDLERSSGAEGGWNVKRELACPQSKRKKKKLKTEKKKKKRKDKVNREKSKTEHKKKRNDQNIPIPERNARTGTLDCTVCDAKLKSAEYYRVHYRAHVSDQLYQCDVCSRTYNTRRLIILHLKKHRPMKYLCDVCGVPNRTPHTLKIHMYSHAGFEQRRYACNLCPRKFSMPDKLKIHQLRHTGVKAFRCNMCEYSFYVKFELTKHLQTHHGVEPDGPKRTQRQRTRSAVTNKPFASVAQPNVRTRGRVKREFSATKSSAIPAGTTCDFCGKIFANGVALKSHRVVHTGDRPYKCDICGKTFKFHSNVLTHNVSVHAVDKTHECATCGARFKLKGNLTVHMKTHTGEKPYACDVCHQKFIRRRNLNNHYKVHMK